MKLNDPPRSIPEEGRIWMDTSRNQLRGSLFGCWWDIGPEGTFTNAEKFLEFCRAVGNTEASK